MIDVSIVIPVKDRKTTLRATLDSITTQTASNWEALIVDDGSDDATLDVAQAALTRDGRFRSLYRDGHLPDCSGAQVCRNFGFRESRGTYVLFLDSDDLLAPHCLEQRVALLEARPELDFCVAPGTLFDVAPRPDDPLWAVWQPDQDDVLAFLENRIPWQTSGPLWRRSALEKIGAWDEDLVHAGHDYEFHLRALAMGLAYEKLDVADYHWRRPRSDSLSSFERFKAHHRDGALILAFEHSLAALSAHNAWTTRRKKAAWREAIRLAALCRLHGGEPDKANRALDAARAHGCAGASALLEARCALAGWGRVFGRIPALSYLKARNLIGDAP